MSRCIPVLDGGPPKAIHEFFSAYRLSKPPDVRVTIREDGGIKLLMMHSSTRTFPIERLHTEVTEADLAWAFK
jgi:hypothetical protein